VGDVLSVEQARAAGLGSSYPDTVDGNALLDERIVSQEQWLARKIGPLLGPIIIERLNLLGGAKVYAKRPIVADSMTVELDGVATDAELFTVHTGRVVRVDGDDWIGRMVVEYEPDDEDAVREALIKLLRLSLNETGMQSETISGSSYSYTRGDGRATMTARDAIVAELLPGGAGTGY
jgi:hypothetical protein